MYECRYIENPQIKTIIICYGKGIESTPHQQYGWKISLDGRVRLFDPKFRGVYATGTTGTPVLVQTPVPNFIFAGSGWDGTNR